MKNIHLIDSNDPSRLYSKNGEYKLDTSTIAMDWYISSAGYKPKNIYITNSEDIKEGWYFNTSKGINKAVFVKNEYVKGLKSLYGEKVNHLEKIILTTDPKLIEDGIQAIEDEFLEWFVKNSSCEFVDVAKIAGGNSVSNLIGTYKIIIPKEEVLIQSSIDGEVIWSTAKETLEEFIIEVLEDISFSNNAERAEAKRLIEIGAIWQQEKQDEFAIGFLNSIRDYELENGSRICFDERDSKELLEIYKKKYERNS